MGLNLAALEAYREARHHHHFATPREIAALAPFARTGEAPASADLTNYALPPGNQGQVGSCVSWATGYTGFGILMNEQHIGGVPMAPMFVYAQIARGDDEGTWAGVALPIERDEGIDTKTHYWQGDFDYTTQPDDAERANAANYRLSGYGELPSSGPEAKAAIEEAISHGMPVPIGFQVHSSFMRLDAKKASDYSYLPGDSSSDPVVGGHEVTIVAYNDQGVKIENSWGGKWGDHGYFTVPWGFFNTGDIEEVHVMGRLMQN
jgi:hypothetical protein